MDSSNVKCGMDGATDYEHIYMDAESSEQTLDNRDENEGTGDGDDDVMDDVMDDIPSLSNDTDDDDVPRVIRQYSSDEDSSDTSDDEGIWFGNLSPASSDSSLAEYGENMGLFEMMNHHLEIFNHEADSFFRVSLRSLYETLLEYIEGREKPTPQQVIDSLPTLKVTLVQIACNTTCPICFAEYEQDEELMKLPCNHLYHKSCIVSWLNLKSTCPTCRLDLAEDSNRNSLFSSHSEDYDSNTQDTQYPDSETLNNTDTDNITENTLSTSSIDNISGTVVCPSDAIFSRGSSSTSLDSPSTSSPTECNQNTTTRMQYCTSSHSNSRATSRNIENSPSTSHTKRSTTLTTTTTKRYSRETEIW